MAKRALVLTAMRLYEDQIESIDAFAEADDSGLGATRNSYMRKLLDEAIERRRLKKAKPRLKSRAA